MTLYQRYGDFISRESSRLQAGRSAAVRLLSEKKVRWVIQTEGMKLDEV